MSELEAKVLDPRRAAGVLALSIAVLATLGAVAAWGSESTLTSFDLDGERNVPAIFSAFLLLACAVLVLRLPSAVVSRHVAFVFAGFLALASLDEATEIHEKLEQRFDVDWQLLYIPAFIAILLVGSLFVVSLRRERRSLALVLAAGGCWVVSQALEALQWEDDGPAAGYTWMMVAEEILEMVGSALLVVALLLVIRTHRPEA